MDVVGQRVIELAVLVLVLAWSSSSQNDPIGVWKCLLHPTQNFHLNCLSSAICRRSGSGGASREPAVSPAGIGDAP